MKTATLTVSITVECADGVPLSNPIDEALGASGNDAFAAEWSIVGWTVEAIDEDDFDER